MIRVICIFILFLISYKSISQCILKNFNVKNMPCDSRGNFYVSLDFDHSFTVQKFQVTGNGRNYGYFDYSSLPLTIGPLKADCITSYEFAIRDSASTTCFLYKNIGKNCCTDFCKVRILNPVVGTCTGFDYNLKFNLQSFASSGWYDFYYDGKKTTSLSKSEIPVVVPHLMSSPVSTFHSVSVCTSNDKVCCDTLVYSNPCVCNINHLKADVTDCDMGKKLFNVMINFDHTATSDSFKVGGNSMNYGTFAYKDLPVTIKNLAMHPNRSYEILVLDKADAFCFGSYVLGVVDTCKYNCNISNVKIAPLFCNDSTLIIGMELKVTNPGVSGLTLWADGKNSGAFQYEEKEFLIELPKKTCGDSYAIQVTDKIKSSCAASLVYKAESCCKLACKISDVEISEVCNDNGLEYLDVRFMFQGNTDSFLITINDTFARTFSYAALPIRLSNVDQLGKDLKIKIRDKKSDVCEAQILYKVKCEKKLPCSITNFDIKPAVCDSNRNFKADFTFKAVNQLSSQFLLSINEGKPDTFVYGQSQYSSKLLFGDCLTKYRFSISDSKDSMCKATFTFPDNICCEIPCKISDLEVSEVCNDNGLAYLNLAFKYQGNADSFLISINDTFVLQANHKALPLKLYNLDHLGKDIRISIRDQKNNNCLAQTHYTISCVKKLPCKLSQLFVKPAACDITEHFRSDFSFKSENPVSSQFVLIVNSGQPDTFSYESLAYSTKLLSGDCKTKYSFLIKDTKDSLCSTTFEFTDSICCRSCKLSEPEVTYLPCINGKYGVKINFNFKYSHQYFIVKCSDRSDTIVRYADLPLIINNLERVRPYQISIYDSLNTSCTLRFDNIVKDCPSSLDDIIQSPEISFDGVSLKVEPNDISTQGELLIYDIAGKIYLRVKFSGRHELNLTPLLNGVYICKVHINQKSFNKKIIKL